MNSTAPAGVALRRLGQAGVDLVATGARVVVDPFLSDYPGRLLPALTTPGDLAEADAVLVTHEHEDHLDLPALASMPDSATVVVVPAPLAERVRAALPRRVVVGARAGEPIEVAGARVIPLPAVHGVHVADGYGFAAGPDGHPFLGYVVEIGGVRLFHAGDALDYPELAGALADIGIDAVLLPINGRDSAREAEDIVGNMTAAEAADLAARSGASTVIPIHYDMFAGNPGPVGEFVELVQRRAPRLHVVVPGLSSPVVLSPAPSLDPSGTP